MRRLRVFFPKFKLENLPNIFTKFSNPVKIKNPLNISKFKFWNFVSFGNTLNLYLENFEFSVRYLMQKLNIFARFAKFISFHFGKTKLPYLTRLVKSEPIYICRYRSYKPIAKWIRKQIFQHGNYSLTAIGDHLYKNATHMLVRSECILSLCLCLRLCLCLAIMTIVSGYDKNSEIITIFGSYDNFW